MRIKTKTSVIKKIWITALIILGVSFVSIVAWFVAHQLFSAGQSVQAPSVIEKSLAKPIKITSNILTTGNIFWGRYMNDWVMASPLKYEYPFSKLHEFDRDKYNAWISGLECPTKSGVNMTSAQMEVNLQFNCSPDYLPGASKWFNIVSLANNHTDNQGVDGFAETQAALDKNGIQYFGHYDPRELNDICEVVSLPVDVAKSDSTETKGNLPVALCGYHGVFRIPPTESLEVMNAYGKLMPVIAFPHMGVEYQSAPDELKTSVYRSMIDNGADMVMGDHPHWVQTTESYKGHLIVYSMGNFMFDQQGNTEVTRSAAIHIKMQTDKVDADLLSKWLLLGDKCKSYHDDCLAQAQKEGLTKLPITYQFEVIASNDADKITRLASDAEKAAILQRMNWQQTMSQLQAPYSSL